MPNFGSKITCLLGLAIFFVVQPPARAGVPAELVAGAMANFAAKESPTPAPEIRFTDGAGKALSLAAFRGKVVLLNFWATWCAPCRREMPDLDRLQVTYGGADFAVVALSVDRNGPAVVPPFYADVGVGHLAVYNDKTMKSLRAFRVIGLPTTLLLDRRGREVGRLIGPAEWAAPEALALIEHLLAEPTAPPLEKASSGG